MNETLALPRIVARLAELAQTDDATASAFISEFVTLIESTLARGEKVSIKQIGTFSPGNPVNFTPAQELAEAVNAPFAIFDAVELPDDYIENDEPAENPDESEEEKELTETSDNRPDAGTSPETVEPEQQPVCAEKSDGVEPNEQTPPENAETDTVVPPVPLAETKRRNHTCLKIAAALLAGFAIGFATGFNVGQNHGTRVSDGEIPIKGIATSDTNDISSDDNPPAVVEPEIVKQAPAIEPEIYDTISRTRFLTTMARKYYGKMDYWVYIYEENSDFLSNPNRISPGTRVKIPPFNKYATSTDDSVNLMDARAKAGQIYDKYQ